MTTKTLQRLFRLLSPYAFWALVVIITTLLLMEQTSTTIRFPHFDKIVHATMFAIMTIVGYFAYAKHRIWLYSGLIIYAALTEIMQGMFTITRHASVYDWLADLTGILLCTLLLNCFTSRFKTT